MSRQGGITFTGLLGVAFIVMKILGVITWPWIWVLAPLWLPALLALVALAIYMLVALWP